MLFLQRVETAAQLLTIHARLLHEIFVLDDLQRREATCHREVIATKGGRMHHAAIQPAESFLIHLAPRDDRRARHVAAAQRFRDGDDVRLEVPIFKPPPAPRATEARLHFVADEKRARVAAEFLRLQVKVVLRKLHALALHGLDDERGNVALFELRLQRGEVAHRDARAALQQRAEAFLKMHVAHHRKRAVRQAVECLLDGHEPRAARRGARKFDRALHRLGARVAEEDRVQVRRQFFQQRLGEQAAEQRAIHLHHVRQVHLQHVAHSLLHGGMVAPDIEDAVAAEKIEVVVPVEVVEVAAARLRIDVIKADDALHRDQRGIQVLLVELIVFAEAGGDEVLEIERHRARTLRTKRDNASGFSARRISRKGSDAEAGCALFFLRRFLRRHLLFLRGLLRQARGALADDLLVALLAVLLRFQLVPDERLHCVSEDFRHLGSAS